ncbi:hypothetical protein [Caballeronia sp. DA-9]|uniref:hypothetical protein n=1 Tax=Caballeronia sp. DA-9 TaxID=3436237 RepID=UPI003F67B7B9
MKTVIALILAVAVATPALVFARGGHYSGGHGSSHKGGHYMNLRTNNHYESRAH